MRSVIFIKDCAILEFKSLADAHNGTGLWFQDIKNAAILNKPIHGYNVIFP